MMEVKLIKVNGDSKLIPSIAAISYGKKEAANPVKLLHKLYKNKHLEPFEFVSFVWYLKIPIFLERQLLRHRISSKVEKSLRYTKPEGDIEAQVFYPHLSNNTISHKFTEAYNKSIKVYQELLDLGVSKQQARAVLPLGLYTQMYVLFNGRSFDNFLRLRLDKHAQPEMQELAYRMLETLKDFDGIKELYKIYYNTYVDKG